MYSFNENYISLFYREHCYIYSNSKKGKDKSADMSLENGLFAIIYVSFLCNVLEEHYIVINTIPKGCAPDVQAYRGCRGCCEDCTSITT